MDLSYTTEYDPYRRTFGWRLDPYSRKGTRGGTAFQIGACRDSQVAQDTSALSRGTYTGAATFSFIQALETYGPRQSYAQVRVFARKQIPGAGVHTCFLPPLFAAPRAYVHSACQGNGRRQCKRCCAARGRWY